MSGRNGEQDDRFEAIGGGVHRRGHDGIKRRYGAGGVLRLGDVARDLSLWAAAAVAVFAAAIFYT
jgi:hypothetical protein